MVAPQRRVKRYNLLMRLVRSGLVKLARLTSDQNCRERERNKLVLVWEVA